MNLTEREFEELEDPENWDFDAVQIQPPVKDPKAVVSMELNRSEFNRVAAAARRRGLPLAEFIRQAALQLSASDQTSSHNGPDAAGNGITVGESETG